MGFFSGLIIGAVGVLVIAYFVWRNNKKKFTEALMKIAEESGPAEEKVKKIIEHLKTYFKSLKS